MRELDLADLITISKGSVEVYNDKRHVKPKIGKKLNKMAIVTLYGIKPKKGQTVKEKVEKLEKQIKDAGGEHISYDEEKHVWVFRVNHFWFN